MFHALHQLRALANQLMAAAGPGMMDGAGQGEHLAALLGGQTRGDQRTAGGAGLHHQGTQTETADDPVAPREVGRLRRAVQRQFRDQRATLGQQAPGETQVPARIELPQAGAQHGDRAAAGLQGALMRRAIDAQRQATGDAEAGRGQAVGEPPGIVQPLGTGLATADQGQLRPFEQLDLSFDEQQRRRIGDLGQQRRIALVTQAEQVAFGTVQPGQGLIDAFAGRRAAAGIRGHCRQAQGAPGRSGGAERRGGTAKGIQQQALAHRAEFRQGMQAKPGVQLGRGEAGHGVILEGWPVAVLATRRGWG